jgi:hypothetical protein
MNDLKVGEHEVLSTLRPHIPIGALLGVHLGTDADPVGAPDSRAARDG